MAIYEALLAVTIEALLLFLLSRLLFGGVVASLADRRGKGLLLGLLRLPGNAIHEFSHCLGFLICGYRVKRVLLCIFDPKGRGSCSPGPAWSPVTFPQLAIGVSALMPLLLGSLALIAMARLLDLPQPTPQFDPQTLLGATWKQSLDLLHGLDWQSWQTYAFLYLALSIGAEVSPSSTDLRYAVVALLILAAGTGVMFATLTYAEHLHHYRADLLFTLDVALRRVSSVLSVALVITATATVLTIVPGLMIQALRRRH